MGLSRLRALVPALVLVLRGVAAAVCTGNDSYSAVICNDDPVFYYRMDANTTTAPGEVNLGSAGAGANDLAYSFGGTSGLGQSNCITGTCNDACVLFTAANSDVAEGVQGGNNYGPCIGAGAAVNGSPHDFTAEAWIKWSSSTGTILSQMRPAGDQDSYTMLTDGTIEVFQAAGGAYMIVTASSPCSSGSWCYSAFVMTAATPKLEVFINNASGGSTTSTTGTCGSGPNSTFKIGSRALTGNELYLTGTVDEVATWQSALSSGTLLNHYNAGVATGGCSDWPCTVMNHFPRFMDDGYMKKVVDRGYITGLFSPRAKQPQRIAFGYLPLAILPYGNVK